MLQPGDVAPDFTLTAHDGREVTLSDLRGKRVILYFYPKADTPGCTQQACAVRDIYSQVDTNITVVLGISPDPPEALVRFKDKYDLPFTLLSDLDHKVAEAYGAWGQKGSGGQVSVGLIRSHVAIDEHGRIMELEIQVKPQTTADLVLRTIKL